MLLLDSCIERHILPLKHLNLLLNTIFESLILGLKKLNLASHLEFGSSTKSFAVIEMPIFLINPNKIISSISFFMKAILISGSYVPAPSSPLSIF